MIAPVSKCRPFIINIPGILTDGSLLIQAMSSLSSIFSCFGGISRTSRQTVRLSISDKWKRPCKSFLFCRSPAIYKKVRFCPVFIQEKSMHSILSFVPALLIPHSRLLQLFQESCFFSFVAAMIVQSSQLLSVFPVSLFLPELCGFFPDTSSTSCATFSVTLITPGKALLETNSHRIPSFYKKPPSVYWLSPL